MSHFSCMIVLPEEPESDKHLKEVLRILLAPFDENTEVDPYRSYTDKPDPNWRELDANNIKFKELIDAGVERKIVWKQVYGDATEVKRGLQYPYWNAYHEGGVNPENDTEVSAWTKASWSEDGMFEVDDNGIYQMSTYNPQSQYDWWELGGRWLGYFQVVEGAKSFLGSPGLFTDAPSSAEGTVPADCARKGDIAVTGMQLAVAHKRGQTYDEAFKRYPHDEDSRSSVFDVTPGQSREDYILSGSSVTDVLKPYAVLAEGVWRDAGKMAWFGMDNSTAQSRESFNTWFERFWQGMPDDAWLAICDLHI